MSITDYDLWPIYFIRILGDIGTTPVSNYLTLTLRKLGFSTFKTNALTIPYNIISLVVMVITGYVSEIINQRALSIAVTPIWIIVCLFPLRYWPGSQVNIWGTYALLTVLLGRAAIWPITITWCSSNSNGVRSRAVSAALVNIFSQSAALISANIYRADDAPLYKRGNTQLIGVAFGALGMCLFTKAYYIWRNKLRDRKWKLMSAVERKEYTLNTTDKGNKRLDFRFVH